MFADAAREVRQHPGRVVATLVAIAISVGFMAAVSIFVSTQGNALGRGLALTTSKADAVVTIATPKQSTTPAQVAKAIKGVAGVTDVEQSQSSAVPLSTDKANVYTSVYATPGEKFRWASLADGSWPSKPTDITLSTQLAGKLGVKVGQTVDAGDMKLTVVGTTNDAPSMFFDTAYLSPATFTSTEGATSASGTWLVAASDPRAVVGAIHDAVAPLVDAPDDKLEADGPANLDVSTGAASQATQTKEITGGFDSMKYVLWVFSAIAAVVGMIIISNTFTILLAQRRRQIGLLRAVGATGSQVRRRFLAEAVLLGLIGSLLGLVLGTLIAWAGASFTKATFWGLTFPWRDLVVEVLIGIVLTVIAAMLPSLRATRVAPLEALQPVATSEQVKRTSTVRAIICGLLALAGLALALSSLSASVGDGASVAIGPVVRALLGSLLLTLGVLFGAPLYVPAVLKLLGKVFGLMGATPRLAASNAVRNPRRASATATALMLACGLIITLQVGTATAQKTVLKEIESRYPVDISVASQPGFDSTTNKQKPAGFSAATLAKLKALPNVKASAEFEGGSVDADSAVGIVVAATPAARQVTDVLPASIADDQLVTSSQVKKGTKVKVTGNGHTLTLTSVPSEALDGNVGIVSGATMTQLVAKPAPSLYWVKLADKGDIGAIMTPLQRLSEGNQELYVSGSAASSFVITKVLNVLLMVITALLGAAVLIALIGVSNTLGLSVVERTRESALLRALGMQKASLRLMLLVEALMLALAGVLVGLVFGSFFGWLGIKAILRQAAIHSPVQFALNWPMTLGLIAVAVVAAALGSVLPGRRAANATPTEALGAE